jgi:hypothetical protein
MDLLRRAARGEMSEIFGKATLEEDKRLRRLAGYVDMISSLQRQETAGVLEAMASLAGSIRDPDFDVESAGNLLAVLTKMRLRNLHFSDADRTVQTLGQRFCSNRSVTELLALCAADHAPYAERIRHAQTEVLALAEAAVAQSLAGNLGSAVQTLLEHAEATLNVRLIDNAYKLLMNNATKVPEFERLKARAVELRALAGAGNRRATLGNQRRQAGGVMLRTTPRPPPGQAPTLPAHS